MGPDTNAYVDPDTRRPLTTWTKALQQLDAEDAQPLHVARFGTQIDAQGVLAGSPDADRCIGYLTKYLVKDVAECHHPETPEQVAHVERLVEALRYQPCAPTCANWLRYGIQPKNPKRGLTPGYCNGKAHRREHLGHGGRRVLVSRKWSGKTMADHKADRKSWVLARLAEAGVSATGKPHRPTRRPTPLRLGTRPTRPPRRKTHRTTHPHHHRRTPRNAPPTRPRQTNPRPSGTREAA